MASINPFASYVIDECREKAKSSTSLKEPSEKYWTLEESIFKSKASPVGQTAEQRLKKSSAEMFVIYKYTNAPLIKVKSEKYNGTDDYSPIKDFFPYKILLQTSPLDGQLS